MKKLIVICLFVNPFLIFGQDHGEELALLNEFLNSGDFSQFRQNSRFSGNGSVSISHSLVRFESFNGRTIPILNLHFITEGPTGSRIVAQIEAIRVNENYSRLPGRSRYLMLYRDFSEFNFPSGSGTVRIYDLNYDEYLVAEASIEDNTVREVNSYRMPQGVASKYDYPLAEDDDGIHHCDLNANGNVSFGECFTCLERDCKANPVCNTLCELTNMSGNKPCTKSMLLACVWISIKY